MRHNFTIYEAIPLIHGALLKPDEKLGMGSYHAWQMPAYRDELRSMLKTDTQRV